MTVHPAAANGFAAAADAYERARPGYPAEVVAWMAEHLGVGPGRVLVDLAAGTGKLTRSLVATGARVIAVEPVAEMRALLTAVLPDVEALDGTAEALPLADGAAHAVTVAQAFHWFATAEALHEVARVLVPGGGLGLVWNHRRLDDPLQAAVEAIIAPHRGEAPHHESGRWRGAFEEAGPFGPLEELHVPSDRHGTSAADLVDRVASTSFIATLPDEERSEVLGRVRALVPADASVTFAYVTDAYVCHRR